MSRPDTQASAQAAGPAPLSIVFVCMGNICRSPTAHGVFAQRIADAGLAGRVQVSSAGTHAYHEGEPPDPRSQAHAARRGYDLSGLRARLLSPADIAGASLVLVMDWDNLALTQDVAQNIAQDVAQDVAQESSPTAAGVDPLRKIRRLTEFCLRHDNPVVPDPYSGGPAGFEQVLDLIEDACDGLLAHVQRRLQP